MKPIFLVPLGHHTTQGAKALTRDGRNQMGLVAESLRQHLRGTKPLMLNPCTDVGRQARQIIADTLDFTEEDVNELCEGFDFMDCSDPSDLRLITNYLRRQIETDRTEAIVLLVEKRCIDELDPAIQNLLWGHTTTDPKRCSPGQFLLYDYDEGQPVLH